MSSLRMHMGRALLDGSVPMASVTHPAGARQLPAHGTRAVTLAAPGAVSSPPLARSAWPPPIGRRAATSRSVWPPPARSAWPPLARSLSPPHERSHSPPRDTHPDGKHVGL